MKKGKPGSSLLILMLGITSVLGAQTPLPKEEPLDFIITPQSFATRGLYTAAADDYLDAANFGNAEFDKWFAYASFDLDTFGSLGYAMNLEKIYLGFYYGGNFFRGFAANTYSEVELPWSGGSTKKFRDYYNGLLFNTGGTIWLPHIYDSSNDNRFAVLIGLDTMGFRLSFASNYDSFHGKDILDSTSTLSPTAGAEFKTFDTAYGWMIPELQWGLTRTLAANGIQPTAALSLGFYREYTRFEAYTGIDITDGEEIIYAANFISPKLSLGLGGYTFKYGDFFNMAFDVDYSFSMVLYNNDYSFLDGTEFKTRSIKGTTDTLNGEWTEISEQIHTLTPSISAMSTGMERLRLGAKLSLPMNFGFGKTVDYDDPDLNNGDLEKLYTSSQSVFTIRPVLDLGMQYEAIPGRLFINAGARIETALFAIYSETTEIAATGVSYKIHGQVFYADTIVIPSGTSLYGGLKFDFNQNFGIDALMAVNTLEGGQNGVNSLSLFGTGTPASATGRLTAFFRILATVRF